MNQLADSKDAAAWQSLHDAEVVAMSIRRDAQRVVLDLLRVDHSSASITCNGVVAVRGQDMVLQNVISRVLQSSRGQLGSEDMESRLTWVTSLSDSKRSWLFNEKRSDFLDQLRKGELNLLVIEPSAGAEVVVLCKTATLA